jgi:chemotaxis protein MotA
MGSFIFGFILSILIVGVTFMLSSGSWVTYLNKEGLMIVLGGTMAVFFMTAKFNEMKLMMKRIRHSFFRKVSNKEIKELLISASVMYEKGRLPEDTGHPFIDKTFSWLKAGLKGDTLDRLLIEGARIEADKNFQAANILNNLSKYPPALGMIGTVFGIIGIFNGLGTEAGQGSLGVSLGFAMTTTLYGLIVSNFMISPLAEFLTVEAELDEKELAMVVETIKLLSEKESSFFIKEHIELYNAA